MATKLPRRVAAKPNPCDWHEDSLLTMKEAAALMWPDGPLSASSLATEYRRGNLRTTLVARKHLVTLRALRAMVEASERPIPPPDTDN